MDYELDLCEKCTNFFGVVSTQISSSPVIMSFHNMQQIIDSAQGARGCHLCNLILTEIGPDKQQTYLQELRRCPASTRQFITSVWHYDKPNQYGVDKKPILRLEEAQRRDNSASRVIVCELRCELLKEMRQHGRLEFARVVRKVHPSTGSWQTFNDIHHWLGDCEFKHTKCKARRKDRPTELPTRLLHVGAFDPSPKIYLQSSSGVPVGTAYATLSHCWGSNMPFKLLQSNVEDFRNGIAIGSLPRTFRETVGLTKALGLDYLWIDSLCIIQDSAEDWATECERMSGVYSGSFINIAADASQDSHGGLFRTRSWKSVTPLVLSLTYRPVGWLREPVAVYPVGEESLSQAPLAHRAWVAQERILAPRTIHFCEHKVVWECPQHFASETDLIGKLEFRNSPPLLSNLAIDSSTFRDVDHFNRSLALPLLITRGEENGANGSAEICNMILITSPEPRSSQPTDPKSIFLDKWRAVVGMFSRGKLTVSTDKLVAISGVARYMQQNLWKGDSIDYYAGLWSHEFVSQLSWSVRRSGGRIQGQTYIAPSWSWASRRGEVIFPGYSKDHEYRCMAQLTYVKMRPMRDPFGAQSSGCLIRMRGPLCRAQHPNQSGSNKSLTLLSSGLTVKFAEVSFDDINRSNDDGDRKGDCLVLLPLVKHGPEGPTHLRGIILQLTRSRPPKRGEYERVGYFRMEEIDVNSAAEQEVNRILGNGSPLLPKDDYRNLMESCNSMDLPDAFYHGRRANLYEFTIV